MPQEERRFKKYLTDRNISMVIRWWAAGAVYFFIGWGTFLGSQRSTIDLMFTLGLVLGLFNVLILNPFLRLMFNLGPKRPPQENTFMQRMSDHLVELIKNIFIVFIVFLIYITINRSLVGLLHLPEDSVPLPGEPVMFGLFYLIVYLVLEAAARKAKQSINALLHQNQK
ncbi:MAG: hypothetical protein EHM70_09660 [Chloroflexota bacterium]|nr:MAG: hypothetical protein EHM70_09660 [Chloroflexota bacterium]